MRLVALHDAINNADVAVNADRVRFVRRATNSRVLIMFDKDHSLTVNGTYEEVVEILKS